MKTAGAQIAHGTEDTIRDADVVLRVRRPSADDLNGLKHGAAVIAVMDPYGNEDALRSHRRQGRCRLRHGIHAAHHPRAGDGRPVLAGQYRRLSLGHRSRRRIRPGHADD